jgi:hypothetical protein
VGNSGLAVCAAKILGGSLLRVIIGRSDPSCPPANVRFAPQGTELQRRRDVTRCAKADIRFDLKELSMTSNSL